MLNKNAIAFACSACSLMTWSIAAGMDRERMVIGDSHALSPVQSTGEGIVDVRVMNGTPNSSRLRIASLDWTWEIDVARHSVRSASYQVLEQQQDGSYETKAPSPVQTVRGRLVNDAHSMVAGALDERGASLRISLGDGSIYWIEPATGRIDGAQPGEHIFKADGMNCDVNMMCGLEGQPLEIHHDDPIPQGGVAGDVGGSGGGDTDGLCVTLLACDSDSAYFADYLSTREVEDRINLVISLMNAQYEEQCGITHEIGTIVVRPFEQAPYVVTTGEQMLDSMREEWNGPLGGVERDYVKLFTGLNMSAMDSVIGQAATLGGIGTENFQFCWSQNNFNPALDCSIGIAAHETGHLWDAPHCDCTGTSMISPCSTVFHPDLSVPIIIAYRASLSFLECNQPPCGPNEIAQINSGDQSALDQFGSALAIDETDGQTIALIGARHDDDEGNNAGAAYVFRLQGETWTEVDKIVASDAASGDKFGTAVGIGNGHLLVGAPLDDSGAGAVYVFSIDDDVIAQVQKIESPDAAADSLFGDVLAVSEPWAVIGSRLTDVEGETDAGAAYVYRHVGDGWVFFERIEAPSVQSDDEFATAVAIEGTRIAVGSPLTDQGAEINAGVVHVYEFEDGSWSHVQSVMPNDVTLRYEFGSAVALDHDQLMVGSVHDHTMGTNAGAAYVFRRVDSEFTQEAKLLGSDSSDFDELGSAVDIEGDYAVVGGESSDPFFSSTGGAWTYLRGGDGVWRELHLLRPLNLDRADEFGTDVVLRDGLLYVSDRNHVVDGQFFFGASGAVFEFQLFGGDCNGNGMPDYCDIADGDSTDADGDGVPDECADDPADPADLNGDGAIGPGDLAVLLGSWGSCPPPRDDDCPADLNGDGTVGPSDLAMLLGAWTPAG